MPPGVRCSQSPTPRAGGRRHMVDAVRYLVAGGITWRAMPADFPRDRVCAFFRRRWDKGPTLTRSATATARLSELRIRRVRLPAKRAIVGGGGGGEQRPGRPLGRSAGGVRPGRLRTCGPRTARSRSRRDRCADRGRGGRCGGGRPGRPL
ncbi:hypothetical protein ACH4E7_33960 [Kitasatospora sp. NPDC018058]|uniref:hypothetical protein n=1 Tax=Kitasatospora sp. NPDC018058 TaxID=3364025 RepID=UPI0037C0D6F8